MGHLSVTSAIYGDWLVMTVSEDTAIAPALLAEQVAAADAGQITGVRVDLRLPAVSPDQVRAVLLAEEAARRRGWRFRLNGNDTVLPLDDAAAAHDWGGGWTGIAPVRLGEPDGCAPTAGLSPPYRGFFQCVGGTLDGVGVRCLDAVRHGGLALSVTTAAAYAQDLAQAFDLAILSRGWRDDGDLGNLMVLCLAEAIGNAVIHGNLGIAGGMRTSREGFERFRALLSERLGDAERCARRVEVSLHPQGEGFVLAVSDHGDGFDADTYVARGGQPGLLQGRGLLLMRSAARKVWYEDGGRCVLMEFLIPAQQQEKAG